MTIGEKIKKRRLDLGMTQDELAKKAGYASRSSINKIELARDLPLDKISKVADALDVSPAELCGWGEKRMSKDELLIEIVSGARTLNVDQVVKLYAFYTSLLNDKGKK